MRADISSKWGKFSAQEHDLKDNDDLVTQLVAKYGLETLKELGREIAMGGVDASAGLCGAREEGAATKGDGPTG